MKYQLLVFDWDGTLVDSAARIIASLSAAFNDVGVEAPTVKQCRDVIGLGLEQALLRLSPYTSVDVRKTLMQRYRHHYLEANDTPTPLFAGVADVVAGLHADGYLMAIATGKSRRGLHAELPASGLEQCFHATRCADDAPSKPHPQMLTELMDELGVSAAHSLMIGDTEYDLQMAGNAGVDAVAVSCGAHESERLLALNPLICLGGVHALPDWLAEQTTG
ncbi:MAG: HAD-IA family hydrolase [Thiohalocapsa sp. PB-PSB1]|jgi:phosphoglycolate phosphatase|nr:MAG: hypothetical protein N838_04505 [Thiohalocapsa sp. PB-PSB1]QQO54476.1 MAG: HAD-IA family hydrolase [Thiohalocapsa sp. PB-PSB1]HCS88771.1 HAD family hydrolase [Chromatiaceae bacterium]